MGRQTAGRSIDERASRPSRTPWARRGRGCSRGRRATGSRSGRSAAAGPTSPTRRRRARSPSTPVNRWSGSCQASSTKSTSNGRSPLAAAPRCFEHARRTRRARRTCATTPRTTTHVVRDLARDLVTTVTSSSTSSGNVGQPLLGDEEADLVRAEFARRARRPAGTPACWRMRSPRPAGSWGGQAPRRPCDQGVRLARAGGRPQQDLVVAARSRAAHHQRRVASAAASMLAAAALRRGAAHPRTRTGCGERRSSSWSVEVVDGEPVGQRARVRGRQCGRCSSSDVEPLLVHQRRPDLGVQLAPRAPFARCVRPLGFGDGVRPAAPLVCRRDRRRTTTACTSAFGAARPSTDGRTTASS